MPISIYRAVKSIVPIFLCALLAGCGAWSLVSERTSSAPSFKLTSAEVVWINKPALPYKISKVGAGYMPPIDIRDRVYARKTIMLILDEFKKEAVPNVRQELAADKVSDGHQVRIELEPVSGSIGIAGAWVLIVKASIKQNSAELWSAKIRTIGNPFMPEEPELPGKMRKDFTSSLMGELRRAGWLE